MAGAGYKLYSTGDVLSATDVNTYLQQQTVMVFASSTARTTALSGVLAEGMVSYLQDTNAVEVYDGAAWVGVGNVGDITAVTAGTGISGGGTSGAVTITNSMATTIDAKGDLIGGTGADAFARLAVGANGTVLTADSAETTGLKWTTPASGSMTVLSTTTLSSTATTISIGTGYKDIEVRLKNFQGTSAGQWQIRFNSDTGSNYGEVGMQRQNTTVSTQGGTDTSWRSMGTASANSNIEMVIHIYDYLNTTRRIGFINSFYSVGSGDDNETRTISYNGSSAISSVTISLAGTISGTAYIVGIN